MERSKEGIHFTNRLQLGSDYTIDHIDLLLKLPL